MDVESVSVLNLRPQVAHYRSEVIDYLQGKM